jgi:hypothetical protein
VPDAVTVNAILRHEHRQEMRIQFCSWGGRETASACSEFPFLVDLAVGSQVILGHEDEKQVVADLLVLETLESA